MLLRSTIAPGQAPRAQHPKVRGRCSTRATSTPGRSCLCHQAPKASGLVVGIGRADLRLAVHDKGPMTHDRLVDRLCVEQQKRRILARLDADGAALALEDGEIGAAQVSPEPRRNPPESRNRAVVVPLGTSMTEAVPALSRRSQRLTGVNVRAGPEIPWYVPAITRAVPAPSGRRTAGICALVML